MPAYCLHWLPAVHQSQQTEPSDQSEQIGHSKRWVLDRMGKKELMLQFWENSTFEKQKDQLQSEWSAFRDLQKFKVCMKLNFTLCVF